MRQHNPHSHVGLGVALLLAGALAGCGGSSGGSMSMNPMQPNPMPPSTNSPSTSAPPAVVQAQQANTPVNPAIVTADNTLGLKLLQNMNFGATGTVTFPPILVSL